MQVAKNEELGLELVTLLNTKEKLQNDKEAAELETMQVIYYYYKTAIFALFMCVWNFSIHKYFCVHQNCCKTDSLQIVMV